MLTTTPRGPSVLLRALAWAAVLPSVAAFAFTSFGIRLNTTASLPIGFYIQTLGPAANLIEFCPADQAASLTLSRGYRSAGSCPDGGEPLLKPIVARRGDIVTVNRGGISVNSRLLPNSRPRTQDSFGHALMSWPAGVYAVAENTVWVVSTYSPQSFDSRYFGPIKTDSIRARLVPLLTE